MPKAPVSASDIPVRNTFLHDDDNDPAMLCTKFLSLHDQRVQMGIGDRHDIMLERVPPPDFD